VVEVDSRFRVVVEVLSARRVLVMKVDIMIKERRGIGIIIKAS
jgi:hypothetical protein